MADSIEKRLITTFCEAWGEAAPELLGGASTLGLLALREVSGAGVEAALAVAATWSSGFFTECSGRLPGVAVCLFKNEDGNEIERLIKPATDGRPRPGGRTLVKTAFDGAATRFAQADGAQRFGDVTHMELSGQEKRLAAIVGDKAWVGTFALSLGNDSDTQALMLYAPHGSLLSLAAPEAQASAPVQSNTPAASRRSSARREEAAPRNIERLLGMELEVIVRFGTTNLPLREVARLGTGMMIELNRAVDEPVELLVNNRSLARGEVVVIDGYYGVRITEIGAPNERPLSLISSGGSSGG